MVWRSYSQDGSNTGVYSQRLDVGGEFRVKESTNGGFTVTWYNDKPAGAAVGGQVKANTPLLTQSVQSQPGIAHRGSAFMECGRLSMLDAGNFVFGEYANADGSCGSAVTTEWMRWSMSCQSRSGCLSIMVFLAKINYCGGLMSPLPRHMLSYS